MKSDTVNSINCLGRRVTSYTTRDAKEIAKLMAVIACSSFAIRAW